MHCHYQIFENYVRGNLKLIGGRSHFLIEAKFCLVIFKPLRGNWAAGEPSPPKVCEEQEQAKGWCP